VIVDSASSSWRGVVEAVRDFAGIVRKAVLRRKLDFVAVVVFGVVGAAAQIGAIGALLGFLRLMGGTQSGGTITWRGIHLTNGLGSLVIAAAVLALMLVLAAVANYWSVRRARAIGRACTEAAVLDLIRMVDRAESMPEGIDSSDLRTMGVRGSRLMGISVENSIRLIHPLVQVVVLAASLFWLDTWATALLLPALLIPLPFLWKFNSGVRASAREFYSTAASGFGKAVGRAVDTLQHARGENETLREAALETYANTPEVESFFGRYDDMSLTSSRAILISSLFRPLILAYVLLLMGVQVSGGDMTWPGAIAFLLVLIQMTARAEGLVAHVSVLSRLYTQVEPFVRFAAHVDEPDHGRRGGVDENVESIVFEFQGESVACGQGEPLQVYSGRPIHKFDLDTLIAELDGGMVSGSGRLGGAAFVGRRYRPSGATGLRLMTGRAEPDDQMLGIVRTLAGELGVADEVQGLLTQVLTSETWDGLSPASRAILQVGPVLCSQASVVLLDVAILTQLDRPQADTLLAHLSGWIIVIVAPDYRSSCTYAETVIALENGSIVWAGTRPDWVTSDERSRLALDVGAKTPEEVDPTLEDELV
jgi:ABC-type multidrug transport system fused ATPase/permease subunit